MTWVSTVFRSAIFYLVSTVCYIFSRTSFSFLDNLRANSSVGPEKLPLTISSSAPVYNGHHSQNIAPIGEEIITWGGMLTRLKDCQGRHIEKSLLLTQTARFSKNRVRCVSQ